jgi:hypothetical protein
MVALGWWSHRGNVPYPLVLRVAGYSLCSRSLILSSLNVNCHQPTRCQQAANLLSHLCLFSTSPPPAHCSVSADSVFHHRSGQSLRARHIDRLYIAVQLLLGTFLVISFPRDPDTQAVWDTFDTGFPNFLVELWVKAHVFRSL